MALILALFVTKLAEDGSKVAVTAMVSKSVAQQIVSLQTDLRQHKDRFLTLLASHDGSTELEVGMAVEHCERGSGFIKDINDNDSRDKPVYVVFDSGEVHFYSKDQARQKLVPNEGAVAGTIQLNAFTTAVERCLSAASFDQLGGVSVSLHEPLMSCAARAVHIAKAVTADSSTSMVSTRSVLRNNSPYKQKLVHMQRDMQSELRSSVRAERIQDGALLFDVHLSRDSESGGSGSLSVMVSRAEGIEANQLARPDGRITARHERKRDWYVIVRVGDGSEQNEQQTSTKRAAHASYTAWNETLSFSLSSLDDELTLELRETSGMPDLERGCMSDLEDVSLGQVRVGSLRRLFEGRTCGASLSSIEALFLMIKALDEHPAGNSTYSGIWPI